MAKVMGNFMSTENITLKGSILIFHCFVGTRLWTNEKVYASVVSAALWLDVWERVMWF